MVDHELFLRKLKVYGVANQELNWCRSYLCNRKQVVHLRRKEPGEAMLRHGVPQGSIIGCSLSCSLTIFPYMLVQM